MFVEFKYRAHESRQLTSILETFKLNSLISIVLLLDCYLSEALKMSVRQENVRSSTFSMSHLDAPEITFHFSSWFCR